MASGRSLVAKEGQAQIRSEDHSEIGWVGRRGVEKDLYLNLQIRYSAGAGSLILGCRAHLAPAFV